MTDRFGLTTFDEHGNLGQVRSAQAAVARGATSLGVAATDGVVIAAEKKAPSPLIDTSTVQKVFEVDEHCGCVYSGIGPDSRLLVDEARKEAQTYKRTYHENIPILQLVRHIANIFQEYTQSGGVRPFGVSLLVCGVDRTGNHLYQLDPSGTYLKWKAVAIGRNATNAKSVLERRYLADAQIEDAINTALITLKDGMDGRMAPGNTEVGVVAGGKFKVLTADQLADYLEQV